MTDEEKLEMQQTRDLFAGIALPGVVARYSSATSTKVVAKECYDIAEAMMDERVKRNNQDELISKKQDECKSNN